VPLVAKAPTEPALPGELTTKPAVPAGFDRGFRRGVPVRRSKVRFTVESCRSLVGKGRKPPIWDVQVRGLLGPLYVGSSRRRRRGERVNRQTGLSC
jgi:hypothetical protein